MIILALGSNLSSQFGDRFQNINLAFLQLEKYGIRIIKKSSFYDTPSYPNKENPKFINTVICVKTNLPPVDLASVLLFIEENLGRKRNIKNDPRTCDIDIIDYENQNLNFKYNNHDFVVPHKQLIYRNFVLFPMQEIIPEWKHPLTNESINILIEKLPKEEKLSILKIKEK